MPIDLPEGVYSGFSIYGDDVFIDNVTSIGEHWSSPKLKPSSKKLENHAFLIQLEGECSFKINNKEETLTNGHYMLISKNCIMERLEQHYPYNHCLWIGFSLENSLKEMPDLLRKWNDFSYVINRYKPTYKSLLRTIINEHVCKSKFSKEIAEFAFKSFIFSIQEIVHKDENENENLLPITQNPTVLQAVDLFDREFGTSWDLKKLSDYLAVSESKLTKAFRNTLGESPMASLWKIRLIKGYEFLVSSSMNISEIAQIVGFQSSQSFATAFRKTFKATPSEVKKQKKNPEKIKMVNILK
ncbi:AraC family transcriptional regulator [Opitutae bacterium]|nr:AraC family transcriptional regulator [Opitutae bacterium]